LQIQKYLSGAQGGAEQIIARISCDEIDVLFFFRDPISANPSEPNDINVLRVCDVRNIPVATNIATGEALIHALERGDLDWREIARG
jgi:methylglyoxal synthase